MEQIEKTSKVRWGGHELSFFIYAIHMTPLRIIAKVVL